VIRLDANEPQIAPAGAWAGLSDCARGRRPYRPQPPWPFGPRPFLRQRGGASPDRQRQPVPARIYV